MKPTTRVLLALVAGFAIGAAVAASGSERLRFLALLFEPVGTLWVNAIRMTVIPLVVALLVVGVTATADTRVLGRVGARALIVFVLLLTAGGTFSALTAPAAFRRLEIDPLVAQSLRETAASSAASTAEGVGRVPSWSQRVTEVVPTNPVKAAADGAMLPLIVFTLLFALAVSRLAAPLRDQVVGVFQALADAMLVIVGWILAVAPIGVFALAITLATRTGLAAAGAIAFYIVVLSLVLIAYVIALYPVAVLVGRVPLRTFALAAVPAQAVAISARSSLAALPAMIEASKHKLRLPPVITSFALPLAVSVLRVNVPIRYVISVLFLAALYGITLPPGTLVSLVVTGVLLSFSVPGIPSASLFMLAPIIASLGIPPEGVGILIAVDALPDMFNTLANVTGHLTSSVVVARGERAEEVAIDAAPDSAMRDAQAD